MAAESVDIDLYADDIGEDFNSDDFGTEAVDLYDDVMTSNSGRRDSDGGESSALSDRDRPVSPQSSTVSQSQVREKVNHNADRNNDRMESSGPIQPLRKHQVYIGNLTWWTSDQDIINILKDIGVDDFVEIKFYENRSNGQSKGYCVLTVGSEGSLKIIHEKFSKREIHGQVPMVTAPTKQALNQFEAQSKTRPSPQNDRNNQVGSGGMMGGGGSRGERGGPMSPMGGPMQHGMNMGYGPPPRMMMGGPGPGMSRGNGPRIGPPPMGGPPGPPHRNLGPPPNQPGPPGGPPGYMGQRPIGPPQNMSQGPPGPRGPPMMGHSMRENSYFQQQNQGPPPPGMNRGGPMPPMMDNRGPPPRDWPLRPPIPPQGLLSGPPPPGAPAPHMNPAFFPSGPGGPPVSGPPPTPYIPHNIPAPQYAPPPVDREAAPTMSEAEFEDIMGRNRTVCSSAISRAVQDAATRELGSAIETLVTAISLIKGSKVASDDRCKILISSLQDTLHGIEAKHYGSGRDRSRSRERDRHRRSRRERSRSRDREYRDRSRERYYEYNPRERSRSREREYRERNSRDESSTRYYDEQRYRERERERERPRVTEVVERPREPERERPPRH